MTTTDLAASLAALAALPCPLGTGPTSGCVACGDTELKYPMLSVPCPCTAIGHADGINHWYDQGGCKTCWLARGRRPVDHATECQCGGQRVPLPLDTEAERQRAVGALMEGFRGQACYRVGWDGPFTFVEHHDDRFAYGASNVEALIAAVEVSEAMEE